MKTRILIKIGGRAFEGETGFKELAAAVKADPSVEIIIVHGGGAEISQALRNADRETVFLDGIRVTPAEDIKIVESVLSGTINQRIASWLSMHGVPCRRMSGKKDRLFQVEPLTRGGQDWGFVGKIKHVNAEPVLDTLHDGQVPVISPIAADAAGNSYNVNADSAAAALAAAAPCSDLVYITDVPGVVVDEEICPSLTIRKTQALIAAGTVTGGMVAKMESAIEALNRNVPRVHIIQWRGSDSLRKIVRRESTGGTTLHA
ncbi:MAG: acetylglutamate kinase [Desulfobacterales bacterium]|jgi:acetylglutamate kinase